MPLISVIVPVYNVETYLSECVDSILSQTFNDFELILVDDGSPDNCPRMCDEFATKDNRIIVIHKENGGLSSARNAGLDYIFEHSNSKFITFIDSDDYVDRNFLKILLEKIEDCDLCICSVEPFSYENSAPLNIEKPKQINGLFNNVDIWDESINALLRSIAVNKLYSRHIFENIRYPIGKIHEDDFVIHHILNECNLIRIIPDCLYYYRLRGGSIMSSLNERTHDIMVLEIMTDRSVFFSKTNFNFFPLAYSKLVKLYPSDKKRFRPFFVSLKNVHKIRIKNKVAVSNGERLFFISPTLFYLLRKSKRSKKSKAR